MNLTTVIKTGLATIATVGLLATANPVVASSEPPTAAPGFARFGHFAPTADPVDVTVDGEPFAEAIGFKAISDYVPVAAGDHRFELRLAGQPDSPVVLAIDATVPADSPITVAAVSTEGGVTGHVFADALTQPPEGQALVRFIGAAPITQSFDVQVANGPTVAAGVAYQSATGYVPITPGQYDVNIVNPGTSDVLLHITGWAIEPGEQASVIIIEGLDGKLDVAPVRDAMAAAVTPAGGIQTGYGGMAPERTSLTDSVVDASVAVVGLAAIVFLAWCVAQRRRVSAPSR